MDFSVLLQEGYKVSTVSVNHVAELKNKIGALNAYGMIDSEFAKEYLPRFNFSPPQDAQSIIIVAMPRPLTKAVFNWSQKKNRIHFTLYLHGI